MPAQGQGRDRRYRHLHLVVAIWGAIRLARPGSWWAAHRYATRLQLARRAASRYDHRNEEFWNRLRDFVADAPTQQTRQEAVRTIRR